MDYECSLSHPLSPARPALTVGIGWVVVEDAASGPVVATQNDEVALVIRGPAEAAVAAGGEAAVLDRTGAEVAVQHPRVHQHNGHVALCQVLLDVLHAHCAVGRRRVSWHHWAPFPRLSSGHLPGSQKLGDTAHLPSLLSSLQAGTSCFVTMAQAQPTINMVPAQEVGELSMCPRTS